MKHKEYVRQVNKEKELNKHNKFHLEKKNDFCLFCEIFPKHIIYKG